MGTNTTSLAYVNLAYLKYSGRMALVESTTWALRLLLLINLKVFHVGLRTQILSNIGMVGPNKKFLKFIGVKLVSACHK